MVHSDILLAMNDQLHEALRGMLADLSDDQLLYKAPPIDERSIADVTLHAYGGVMYFASIAAGRDWPGETQPPPDLDGLLDTMGDLHEHISALLSGMSECDLGKMVTMPWGQRLLARDAVLQSFAHGFIHSGQIGGIRAIGGFPTPPESY